MEADIFLSVTKGSLKALTSQTGDLIRMVSEMGLIDIEGDLRKIFEKLLVLTAEVDNYDEAYLIRHQTMYQLSQALQKDAYQEHQAYWDGRPQLIKHIPRAGEAPPIKGTEDML